MGLKTGPGPGTLRHTDAEKPQAHTAESAALAKSGLAAAAGRFPGVRIHLRAPCGRRSEREFSRASLSLRRGWRFLPRCSALGSCTSVFRAVNTGHTQAQGRAGCVLSLETARAAHANRIQAKQP